MTINLPTRLTLLRLFLIPPFLLSIYFDNALARISALLFFGFASLTDYYDGKLAREMDVVTTLGKFLDPLADKLLISSALISFVQISEIYVPAWMVVLIIGREFLITGLRTLAISYGRVLAAQPAGKFKTTSQIVSILLILIILVVNSCLEEFGGIPKGSLEGAEGMRGVYGWILVHGATWLIGITTFFTILSGYIYIKNNRDLFNESLIAKI